MIGFKIKRIDQKTQENGLRRTAVTVTILDHAGDPEPAWAVQTALLASDLLERILREQAKGHVNITVREFEVTSAPGRLMEMTVVLKVYEAPRLDGEIYPAQTSVLGQDLTLPGGDDELLRLGDAGT